MLTALRKQATSWVVCALLILLIVAFAVWGIGDVLRGGGVSDVVAEVEGLPITAEELRREADAGFDRLQTQLGGRLERTPELMEGLYRQALQGAIARRLLDAHAAELGLDIGDEALARVVREDPLFQTAGQFDRSRFEFFLRSLGFSEAGYLARVESDMLRNRLVTAVTGPATASTALARRLAAWRDEERQGRALLVLAERMEVAAPNEAELQAYLEAHADDYRAPEYRQVELAVLGAQDLLDEVAVSEDELREAYETRKASFVEPEKRIIVQLLASDKAVIEEAAERVREGESFAEVADALADKGVTTTTVGPVEAGELPAALGDAAFALGEGEVSEPIETPFGWHLLRVAEVVPRRETPFEEARAELEAELRRQKAADRLPEVATALDDALAGGASLAEAAQAAGARYYLLEALDRQGRDKQGDPITEPRLTPDMLDAIFAAGEEEVSLVEETEDGRFYVFKVVSVEPPRTRDLAEVREAVERAWREEKQREAAKARAAELLEAAKSGQALEGLAAANPAAELREIGPVTREASPQAPGLGPAAVAALFATPPGEIADDVAEVPGGAAIVATDEILPADPTETAASLQEEIARARREELLAQYEDALRRRYEVEINERSLNAWLAR